MSEGPLEGEVRAFARRSEQISFVSLRIQTLLLRLIKKEREEVGGRKSVAFFSQFCSLDKKSALLGGSLPFLVSGGTFLPFFFFLLFFYAYPSSDLFLLSLFSNKQQQTTATETATSAGGGATSAAGGGGDGGGGGEKTTKTKTKKQCSSVYRGVRQRPWGR